MSTPEKPIGPIRVPIPVTKEIEQIADALWVASKKNKPRGVFGEVVIRRVEGHILAALVCVCPTHEVSAKYVKLAKRHLETSKPTKKGTPQ